MADPVFLKIRQDRPQYLFRYVQRVLIYLLFIFSLAIRCRTGTRHRIAYRGFGFFRTFLFPATVICSGHDHVNVTVGIILFLILGTVSMVLYQPWIVINRRCQVIRGRNLSGVISSAIRLSALSLTWPCAVPSGRRRTPASSIVAIRSLGFVF